MCGMVATGTQCSSMAHRCNLSSHATAPLAPVPPLPQFDWMLKQDPKHELIYFGLVVNVGAGLAGRCLRLWIEVAISRVVVQFTAVPAVCVQGHSLLQNHKCNWCPCLQASAWTPGVYEEQQRAAGLRPYRCEPNGLWRDRNVHLK